MADNETIADIRKDAEAKFRELVEAHIQWRDTFQTTVGAMQAFNTVFDRLEAAHKRECGDCAKLRKALGKLRAELWNNTVIAGKRKFELYEIADAALAAPPRNCDKYPHDQALRIWSADPENPMNGCFDVWLYAPAAEKEGGNDGK